MPLGLGIFVAANGARDWQGRDIFLDEMSNSCNGKISAELPDK
jgi:hypothetical protein